MRQTFEIETRVKSYNDYLNLRKKSKPKIHYFPANKYKRDLQDEIIWAIRKRRLVRIAKPVIITFVWYEEPKGRQKARDKDNIAASKKFFLDAMQEAHILPNDNDDWILGFADYFIYGHGQKVVVHIDEVEGAEADE